MSPPRKTPFDSSFSSRDSATAKLARIVVGMRTTTWPESANVGEARTRVRTSRERRNEDVHLAAGSGDFQRAKDYFAIALGGEIFVERAAVDLDLSAAQRDAHARDRALAAADAPDVFAIGLLGFAR